MVSGWVPAGACLVRPPWIRPSSSPRAPQGLGAQGEPDHSYLRNLKMHLDYSLFAINRVFRKMRSFANAGNDMHVRWRPVWRITEHSLTADPPAAKFTPCLPMGRVRSRARPQGPRPQASSLSPSPFLLSEILRNLNHHHLQPLQRIFRCD